MKSPEERIERWLHPVVFATWAGFLIYLLISMRYVAFLRPEFGLLLAVAHFVATGFMIASMVRPKTHQNDGASILRALVLLVPVLYLVAMPHDMLGSQAFKKRFTGTNNGAIGRPAPPANSPEASGSNSEDTAPAERTILDIFLNPNHYIGKRVIVTGMMMHDEQLKPHFGGRQTAVYRFLINCCAADALPLAIALDSDQADAFDSDQWVQVDGIFDLQQINGKPVPILSEAEIKPVKAPAMPYLF